MQSAVRKDRSPADRCQCVLESVSPPVLEQKPGEGAKPLRGVGTEDDWPVQDAYSTELQGYSKTSDKLAVRCVWADKIANTLNLSLSRRKQNNS